ncbi:MAG: tetraacyldisaccharide 4'-kinase [Alphaproteobacteria bacterium]|nr:tetraacyldisaccharide 4'-kinase [Alphaproteobacteria bacterium]
MRRAPEFWARDGLLPRLLQPAASAIAAITARRVARPGWRAPVPVICCGNVSVGGAGKTTLALDLATRIAARGVRVHCLLRGYGGQARGVRRVQAGDAAAEVGDEALLLAEAAPTWIGADRAASARAAIASGAEALVMDDGLQNASLHKDFSLLVVDGGYGFGNGRVLPAGPLREPVAVGAARCRAAVLIGADDAGAARALPPSLPVLRARLVPAPDAALLTGRRVLAFAGIGRPEKFFATVEATGGIVVGRRPFPDHHPYSDAELAGLIAEAARLDALPVTTAKDAVRIPAAGREKFAVVGVTLAWERPAEIEALLTEWLSAPRSSG